LYHEKPSICNICVKFHDNYLSIAEILPWWSKIAVANIANKRMRNAYLGPALAQY